MKKSRLYEFFSSVFFWEDFAFAYGFFLLETKPTNWSFDVRSQKMQPSNWRLDLTLRGTLGLRRKVHSCSWLQGKEGWDLCGRRSSSHLEATFISTFIGGGTHKSPGTLRFSLSSHVMDSVALSCICLSIHVLHTYQMNG